MSSTLPLHESDFRKASASHPDRECVRVARRDGRVELRDDKTAFGAQDDVRLVFTEAQFDEFLTGTRSGRASGLCLTVAAREDGTYSLRSTVPQPAAREELQFTEGEVQAFLDGVHRAEFDRDAMPSAAVLA